MLLFEVVGVTIRARVPLHGLEGPLEDVDISWQLIYDVATFLLVASDLLHQIISQLTKVVGLLVVVEQFLELLDLLDEVLLNKFALGCAETCSADLHVYIVRDGVHALDAERGWVLHHRRKLADDVFTLALRVKQLLLDLSKLRPNLLTVLLVATHFNCEIRS